MTLETVARCMPAGILIGVVVLIFSLQHALLPAYALLILIGILGGFFVVPLNALLQEWGKQTVGAGNAIAVQNRVKTGDAVNAGTLLAGGKSGCAGGGDWRRVWRAVCDCDCCIMALATSPLIYSRVAASPYPAWV